MDSLVCDVSNSTPFTNMDSPMNEYDTPEPASAIQFNIDDEVVIEINEKGLTYRGELAADAGECYAMLTEFLNRAKGATE